MYLLAIEFGEHLGKKDPWTADLPLKLHLWCRDLFESFAICYLTILLQCHQLLTLEDLFQGTEFISIKQSVATKKKTQKFSRPGASVYVRSNSILYNTYFSRAFYFSANSRILQKLSARKLPTPPNSRKFGLAKFKCYTVGGMIRILAHWVSFTALIRC